MGPRIAWNCACFTSLFSLGLLWPFTTLWPFAIPSIREKKRRKWKGEWRGDVLQNSDLLELKLETSSLLHCLTWSSQASSVSTTAREQRARVDYLVLKHLPISFLSFFFQWCMMLETPHRLNLEEMTFCLPKLRSPSKAILKSTCDSVLVTQTSVIIHRLTLKPLTLVYGPPWDLLSTAAHRCYFFNHKSNKITSVWTIEENNNCISMFWRLKWKLW